MAAMGPAFISSLEWKAGRGGHLVVSVECLALGGTLGYGGTLVGNGIRSRDLVRGGQSLVIFKAG